MREKKLSPDERLMLQRLEEQKKHSCFGCNKLGCNTCGYTEYEVITSSSGRWVKHPDERCDHAYGL